MQLQLEPKDRDKVIAEISELQARILQTIIPTILAVGLISIADREKFALITLIATFSVLFSTSLYIASLSYKIFRNASFIKAISDYDQNEKVVTWEKALSSFHQKKSPPWIIGYETKTIATIYIVFSLAFIFMFYQMNLVLTLVLGVLLLGVAFRIAFIPQAMQKYYLRWKDVLDEFAG